MRGRPHLTLLVCGLLSLVGYVGATLHLEASGSTRDLATFLGLWAALFGLYAVACRAVVFAGAGRRDAPAAASVTFHVLIWATLLRLALLPAGLSGERRPGDLAGALLGDLRGESLAYEPFLLYDNDIWRYLWDGHVAAHGHDPYAATPRAWRERADAGDRQAEALFEDPSAVDPWRFDEIHDLLSFRDYTTVYPPLAQAAFRLSHALAPGSAALWKLLMIAVDLGTCGLLVLLLRRLGRPPGLALLYAWNPLAIKEIAGSGHVDGLMIFWLTATVLLFAWGRRRWGLVAFALAILAKLVPMLLAPLVLRRAPVRDWPIAAGVVLLGFAPYWNSLSQLLEGLLAFARHWVFNPGIWAIWRWIGERTLGDGRALADPLTALLMLGLVAWTLRRDDGSNDFLVRGTVVLLGGYVVLSATIMPWYLLWVLPLATTLDPRRAMPWLVLTGLSLLSYLIYIDQIERSWWLWVEHGTFWALVVRARLRTSSCERPARVPPGELFGISE